MNTTELLDQPVDRQLLGLLELPDDLPEHLSIAEAAAITGLTAHTLRYYERIGLVQVGRDDAGYRSYDRRAMGRIAFVTRTNILNTLHSPHVVAARARGNRQLVLITRHVLRNVSVPTVALCAVEVTGMVVGGSTVVETVFAWPGMGRLFVTSMQTYDLPVVSAILVVGAVFVLILNIAIDNLYALLDPRVRYE